MKNPQTFHLNRITQLVAGSLLLVAAHGALADTVDLGTVRASGNDGTASNSVNTDPASAAYQAPSQGSLTATQPESIINQHFIQENEGPAANFSDIVSMTPSVWSVDPNGVGGMESQSGGPFIRGFQNGQYNVTFDGIPWGDSNDFTQHSTVYFMPQDLGSVVVDRGPGDASNIGNATFGGTIASYSRVPSSTSAFDAYTDVGSFNSRLVGASFDTGLMHQYGDASAFISYKDYATEGYISDAAQRRTNLFVKLLKPISDNTVMSFVSMQNTTNQNPPQGATLAQMQQYGKNYGLNGDPTSQNFQGYNYDHINTDFEYIGLQSELAGGWHIDNKLYTYAYEHNGANGADLGGGISNGTAINSSLPPGTITNPTDVPGQLMTMDYRSIGDILRVSKIAGPGIINTGIWYDRQVNTRSQFETDMTTGGYNYLNTNPVNGQPSPTDRLMSDSLTSIQPYLDYAWKPTSALTITPGVKYDSFTRNVNATVLQGTNLPYSGSNTWNSVLPSLDARYMIQNDWSSYLQIAKGFQAPNLNVFYKPGAEVSTLNPQTTMNYQLGTTYTAKQFVLSADIYMIKFNNLLTSSPAGNYTIFSNAGGAEYKGVELEGTYHLGAGFNLYGNYAFDYANLNSDNSWLANTPEKTGAFGIIYNQGPVYASLMTKFVSERYGDVGQTIPLASYSTTNFNASYKINNLTSWTKETRVGLQVFNLFDNQQIYALSTYNNNNVPMYYTLPGRAMMVNLSLSM